ncbi:hypothetical protein ACP275_02G100900 [Erythranthe tilingii]
MRKTWKINRASLSKLLFVSLGCLSPPPPPPNPPHRHRRLLHANPLPPPPPPHRPPPPALRRLPPPPPHLQPPLLAISPISFIRLTIFRPAIAIDRLDPTNNPIPIPQK